MGKKISKVLNKEKREFYVVDKKVLPIALQKVIEVNNLIETREISKYEAAKIVGISRSTYYKYADHIKPFYEESKDQVLNLYLTLEDKPGVLSEVLDVIAASNVNILTIIQNIPVNGTANATISVEVKKGIIKKNSNFLEDIKSLSDVRDIRVIGNV